MRTNEKVLEFNVDAYTARLIGRENVSKLEGAVLEIVKMLTMQMRKSSVSTIPTPKTAFISWIMVRGWRNKLSSTIG